MIDTKRDVPLKVNIGNPLFLKNNTIYENSDFRNTRNTKLLFRF
jgi:hypothetical protein